MPYPDIIALLVIMPILGSWIVLSIAYARPRNPMELSKFGPFGLLIPSWNFFAPNPGVHDYRLLYRDQLASGQIGSWREISGFADPRPWWSLFWNPMKIRKKALFDITNLLISELPKDYNEVKQDSNIDFVKLTVPYISLLTFVAHLPSSQLVNARQFMIMRESKTEVQLDVLMISGLHSLE